MRFDLLTELKLKAIDLEFKAADYKFNKELKKDIKKREHDEKVEQIARDILKEEEIRAAKEDMTTSL